MKSEIASTHLTHDPVHGYIPFTSPRGLPSSEVSEREVIDHPWVQRLRQIRQLQTAWWVFPTAEHSRFQHVLGVMHLASRVADATYDSLVETCSQLGETVPSRGYVECLLRMSGLLHDVGHGPFGHFFDAAYLSDYDLTHEKLGAIIIRDELGELLKNVRRTPSHQMEEGEQLDPADIAWMITRPSREADSAGEPRPIWQKFLRSLLSGIYTIDNMDFVLRDAYMTGYSSQSFDLDRLLHYSFFSHRGLTIHERGMGSLVRFMAARADLFRTVYFHRTVRAIDLTLGDLFPESKRFMFPGNPAKDLDTYRRFTEFSLLVDVDRWRDSEDETQRMLGQRWSELLQRRVRWKMVCQRSLVYEEGEAEQSSIFSDDNLIERQLRKALPDSLRDLPLRIDTARHIYRPNARGPVQHQNFLYDAAREEIRPLGDHQLFRRLPISHRICRVYAESEEHAATIAKAVDQLIGPGGIDDLTNM